MQHNRAQVCGYECAVCWCTIELFLVSSCLRRNTVSRLESTVLLIHQVVDGERHSCLKYEQGLLFVPVGYRLRRRRPGAYVNGASSLLSFLVCFAPDNVAEHSQAVDCHLQCLLSCLDVSLVEPSLLLLLQLFSGVGVEAEGRCQGSAARGGRDSRRICQACQ